MPETDKPSEKRAAQAIVIRETVPAFDKSPAKDRIDRAAGVIRDVTIFAPRVKGKYLVSQRLTYDARFLDNVIPVLEGALGFPRHSSNSPSADEDDRSPFEAKGVHRNIRRDGNKLKSDFHPFPQYAEEVFAIVENAWKSLAFSMEGRGTGFYDGQTPVAVTLLNEPKPTIDFVKDGSASLHIFESAKPTGDKKMPDETIEQQKQESQTDDIALKVADLIEKTSLPKMEARIREALKPELDKAREVSDKQDAAERKLKIREAILASKLEEKYVTPLMPALEAAKPEEWEGILKEQKTLLAGFQNPVNGMGGDRNADAPRDIHVGRQPLHVTIREMAGRSGFDTNKESSAAFTRQWQDKIGNRIADFSDDTQETRKLRLDIIEAYQRTGLKNLFGFCYGEMPLSINHMNQLLAVREVSPVDNSGFSSLNRQLMAAVGIERYQISDRTADQLVRPYPTNKEVENVRGFDAPTGESSFTEGNAPPDITIAPKYVQLQHLTKKFGGVVSLTREAVFYDQTGQLVDAINAFVDNVALKRQRSIIYAIADWGGASNCGNNEWYSYYPSGVRAPLWVGYNTQESNALSTWQNVDVALDRLGRQTDSNGEFITDNTMTPLIVLIPWALRATADRVFGAEFNETRLSTTSLVNSISNRFRGTTVIISKLLDALSPATWYIAGAGGFQRQFLNKETFKFEIVPLPPEEIQGTLKDLVAGVKCEFLEKTHARDNRRVIRNTSGAAS